MKVRKQGTGISILLDSPELIKKFISDTEEMVKHYAFSGNFEKVGIYNKFLLELKEAVKETKK